MRTYTWTHEGNEKTLEISTNFLRYQNEVISQRSVGILNITEETQLLLFDCSADHYTPTMAIQFDTKENAKEVLDMILRAWYPYDFEERGIPREINDPVRRTCLNACEMITDFSLFTLRRSLQIINQLGTASIDFVRTWWAVPEAHQHRE